MEARHSLATTRQPTTVSAVPPPQYIPDGGSQRPCPEAAAAGSRNLALRHSMANTVCQVPCLRPSPDLTVTCGAVPWGFPLDACRPVGQQLDDAAAAARAAGHARVAAVLFSTPVNPTGEVPLPHRTGITDSISISLANAMQRLAPYAIRNGGLHHVFTCRSCTARKVGL